MFELRFFSQEGGDEGCTLGCETGCKETLYGVEQEQPCATGCATGCKEHCASGVKVIGDAIGGFIDWLSGLFG